MLSVVLPVPVMFPQNHWMTMTENRTDVVDRLVALVPQYHTTVTTNHGMFLEKKKILHKVKNFILEVIKIYLTEKLFEDQRALDIQLRFRMHL